VLPACSELEIRTIFEFSERLPIGNRRYSRLETCATPSAWNAVVVAKKGLKTRTSFYTVQSMKPLSKWLLAFSLLLLAVLTAYAAQRPYTIAVIPKGTTHEFWKSIHAGAVKAQQELQARGMKVNLIWRGPLREDDRDQQIQVVENFTIRRVNGIVLAPLDSQALVRPVNNAAKAKVPVVIIDSDLKSDSHVSFVATDNFKGGQMAGEYLGQLLGGKGNVILLRYAVGSASTEAREAGFLNAITNKYPEIKIISSDQYAGPTRETAYQASQNLLNRFAREVDGIFCPCEPPTVSMAKALRDIGLAGGKVKMVGFDAGTASVQDLRNGDVQGLIVQNPLLMGYLGVMTLMDHLQGKPVERRVDTGVMLVTQENMSQAEIQELLNPPLSKYLK
jgi:ribose transport system substrate-binding protein